MHSREPRTAGSNPWSWSLLALLGILAAALMVRLWGINYGLPYIYHTDEVFEVKRALKLGAGQFDLHRAFKGGLYYILFVEYSIHYAILFLLGEIRSSFDYLVRFFARPTEFWLIGRITVAVIGTLNVYVLFRLGKRIRNTTTGILAALFLAFAFEHANSSHYITVDILMVTLVTLSFLQIISMIQKGRWRNYLFAALFAAFAVTTKLTSITILLAIAVAGAYRIRHERKPFYRFFIDRRILLAVGVFAGTMAVINPGFFPEFYRLLSRELGMGPATAPAQLGIDPFPSRTDNIWAFYANTLISSMGLPIFLLSLAGLALALPRKRVTDLALFVFAAATYLLICLPWQPDLIYARYTLPIQMVLAIYAAVFLDQLYGRFRSVRGARVALTVVALLVVATPLYRVARNDRLMTRTDTRTAAKEWVESHIPAGSKIVIEGRGYGSSPNTVPLRNTTENIRKTINRYRSADPRWGADKSYGPLKDRFHRAAIVALEGKRTYDLVLMGSRAPACLRLQEYLEMGVEYVIIDPVKFGKFLVGINRNRFPTVGDLYRDILDDPRLGLLKRFEPSDGLGPVLEIYRVEKGE